jgi:hypothetical protein
VELESYITANGNLISRYTEYFHYGILNFTIDNNSYIIQSMFGDMSDYLATFLAVKKHSSTNLLVLWHSALQGEIFNTQNLWALELEAWFKISFLKSFFPISGLLKSNSSVISIYDQSKTSRIYDIVDIRSNNTDNARILFPCSDSTNIDFIQFLAITIFLSLLCFFSYDKELINMYKELKISIWTLLRYGAMVLLRLKWPRSILKLYLPWISYVIS